jgi:acylphosphatase
VTEGQTEALKAIVRGYVQGVGYRAFVQQRARALGVNGYARNLSDGNVEVVAEGPRPALESLLKELEGGPPASYVERIEPAWGAASGQHQGFVTR